MSSEIERAVLRSGAAAASFHGTPPPRLNPGGSGAGGIASVLEVNQALSSIADLQEALQAALEALARHPGIARGVLTLTFPGGEHMAIEGAAHAAVSRPALVDPRIARAPIVVEGKQVGALGAELSVDSPAARDRAELLLQAVTAVIAQSLTLRGLLGGGAAGEVGGDDESAAGEPPEADDSLSGLVSAYEKRLIEEALRSTRGNRARAAKLLRTTERIIGYRVQQYGIDCRVYRE